MQVTGFAAGPLETNCYIVVNEHSGEAIIVDPSLGAHSRAEQFLQEHGLRAVAVVLTHGHIDHTRDAGAFGLETYIHAADAFMLTETAHIEWLRVPFQIDAMPPVERVTTVGDGERVSLAGLDFTVRHAPGHSPGSCLWVHEDFVLTGDVLFQGGIGRTDLPFSDDEAMQESLRGPVWELEDRLPVLPGHGPTSTMARERETNTYLREAMSGR
ncbi:MBL fold metallo-hydrolase [Corynebacterium liangguodongii]|uniref:Hydrolase n=1 Tax=Corynebacterium liangguodongii TaxID=2079535 RepID=A0A2S0WEF7_9CORY|nr:MBL fold metallo-hydrolase [Corynebacterium liangguodongii]AWB84114.1 hydrolase [Corynebacterium liangguodongii]PWC00125.1 MBL fold metallo-hydrolase [Corynebacterium liangguodongii]